MSSVAEMLAEAKSLHHAGRLTDALLLYRQILAGDPANVEVHYLQAMACDALGNLDEAAGCWQRLAELLPADAAVHAGLGAARARQGNIAAAAASLQRAVELKPAWAEAHNNLGALCEQLADWERAAACYRRATDLKPEFAVAHHNLGGVLERQGSVDSAAECYRRACELAPDFAAAHYQLGTLNERQERFADAEACYRRVVAISPEVAEAQQSLADSLRKQGRWEEAAIGYRRTLQLQPDNAEAHCNLGFTLRRQGKLDEVEACFRRALELTPNYVNARANFASFLKSQGRLDEAIESYRAAIALDPAHAAYHSNLLYALNYHPDQDAERVFGEHRDWARRHADPLTVASGPHANDRSPTRRLRVGYISPHFWDHAVNFFSEPILAAHDHQTFEVFCYAAMSPAEADGTTRRLQGFADHWRDISRQSDEEACAAIRADRIDILVDLTGHIAGNRLLVFARKPAPVQVTYIGYQNTTGMLAMDYRLTDDWADPPGRTDAYYTERLVRLPRAFFCYLPSSDAPEVGSLPALAKGAITFGSLNNFNKVTPQVLATWAEILSAVPESRLVLLAPLARDRQEQVRRGFEERGVRAQRVELVDRLPRRKYFELINRVDVALDPFPFNGHTTTCDCLWMGVPVVMLAGQAYASRFGGTALVNLGLEDLIASTRDEYLAVARGLAGDRERLQTLRKTLRNAMLSSPLLDSVGFTRNLEAAYRAMWRQWCEKAT